MLARNLLSHDKCQKLDGELVVSVNLSGNMKLELILNKKSLSLLACLAFTAQASIPSWVLNPNVDKGLAAVDCVEFSGNVSVDAKLASSNARLALAQQIGTKVEAIDETFDSRISSGKRTNINSKFSSASKQITKQSLSGSKIVRSDIVKISGKDYFCSMAVLSEQKTEQLFNSLVEKSEVKLDEATQAQLKKTFTSQPQVSETAQVQSLIDES